MSLDMVMSIQRKRRFHRLKSYENIFNKVRTRINHYTKFGQTSCYYEIPHIIYGVPHVNMQEIREFIENKLIKEGFIVIRVTSTSIYISWEETIINKQKEINDLRQKGMIEDRKAKELQRSRDEDLLRKLATG